MRAQVAADLARQPQHREHRRPPHLTRRCRWCPRLRPASRRLGGAGPNAFERPRGGRYRSPGPGAIARRLKIGWLSFGVAEGSMASLRGGASRARTVRVIAVRSAVGGRWWCPVPVFAVDGPGSPSSGGSGRRCAARSRGPGTAGCGWSRPLKRNVRPTTIPITTVRIFVVEAVPAPKEAVSGAAAVAAPAFIGHRPWSAARWRLAGHE